MEREIWRNPGKHKKLDEAQVPLWFWNDRLTKKELVRQLELQTAVGVTCTNPHARTNGGEGYIGGYLDEEWFNHIQTVLDYKKNHQEPMWLYDEIDWPAGTCNKTITKKEENREQYLMIQREEIPANTKFRAQLKKIGAAEDDYNVYLYRKADGTRYELEKYLTELIFGPELEFEDSVDAVAYIVSIHVDAYEYEGDMQVNYLDANATREFLKSTYEQYYEYFPEDFGRTIRCVFNDETRMCHPLAWSRDFAECFEKQKGYDIIPHLPQLIMEGTKAGRIRCDYYDVLAYLYQKNYFGEIHSWCHKHGVKLFAHLLGEETLHGHVRYSGDYLRQNRYLDIPGADHLGKGIGSLNIKFTSAGAHSYGKDMTAVEVFAGCGWDLTFEEYIRMITWMYQQGMKIIINHGFFYSDRGRRKDDWPPSQFFQWKGFTRMKEGNDMVRRLHYAMTGGVSEADVLVYVPMESMWHHFIPDMHFTHGFAKGGFLKDEKAVCIDQGVQQLLSGLQEQNLDFELLHKDAVNNFQVRDGKICNVKNGQQFSVLVLPWCEVMSIESMRLIADYAREGGKVIMVNGQPTYAMPQEEEVHLREMMVELAKTGNLIELTMGDENKIYESIRSLIPMPVNIIGGLATNTNDHRCYPSYLIDPYMHGGEDITGIMYTRYLKDGKRNTLFANYGSDTQVITVELATTETPEIWDALLGKIEDAKIICSKSGYCTISLPLPAGHGVMVVS